MGWNDRPYAQEEGPYHGSGLSALSVTTMIIIANVVIAFLTLTARSGLGATLVDFGIMQPTAVLHGQIWRLFTATYLHANFNHILFNMLGLYFLGPGLEQVWGRRQYFFVYTLGGIAGNVLLTLAGAIGFINPKSLGLGASGSVLTLLGAAAVLFPQAQVYVYFLFPVRIRTVAVLYGIWYVYNVFTRGANFGGDMCHIAGLAVGLAWAYTGGISLSGRHRVRAHPGSLLSGLFRRRPPDLQRQWRIAVEPYPDEAVVDRILAKIHAQGIASLSEDEKRILREAQQRRQAEERGQR